MWTTVFLVAYASDDGHKVPGIRAFEAIAANNAIPGMYIIRKIIINTINYFTLIFIIQRPFLCPLMLVTEVLVGRSQRTKFHVAITTCYECLFL